jgi:hypothetical protein
MRYAFLRAGAGLLVTGISIVACGGKVVFDSGASGAGGNGGSSTTGVLNTSTITGTGTSVTGTTGFVSSTDVGPSTTTGASCDCNVFCDIAKQCGFGGSQCQQFCPQVPPNVLQCVCQVGPNCGALQMCIGAGPGQGPGPGSTGSGGGFQCSQCANDAAQNQCAPELDKCSNNPECVQIVMCHQSCGFGSNCFDQCDAAHPNGSGDYASLIQCAVCSSCGMQCGSQQVFSDYCLLK